MKAKYDFIHEAGALNPDTVFVTVMVGRSNYDRRALQVFNQLRFIPDCYFAKHDEKGAEFIGKVYDSIFPSMRVHPSPVIRLVFDVKQFKEYLNTRGLWKKIRLTATS